LFLLVVATYFLVAPERITKRAPTPTPPTGLEAVPGGKD